MQTVCTAQLRVAASAPARTTRTTPKVVCAVQQQQLLKKAAAAGVSVPALLAASPALALVDDRLATEGTGLAFGISDPALFWVISIVFATVWGVFYVSTRDVDTGDNDEDYGLKL